MSAEIDGYTIAADDLLADEQRAVSAFLAEARTVRHYYFVGNIAKLPLFREWLELSGDLFRRLVAALASRQVYHQVRWLEYQRGRYASHQEVQPAYTNQEAYDRWEWEVGTRPENALRNAITHLIDARKNWNPDALIVVLEWAVAVEYFYLDLFGAIIRRLEASAKAELDASTARAASMLLEHLRNRLAGDWARYCAGKDAVVLVERLARVVEPAAEFPIENDEPWTAAALAELTSLDTASRTAWSALLNHCRTAGSAAPSAKWLKTADKLLRYVGSEDFCLRAKRWIPRLEEGREPGRRVSTNVYRHTDVARGLAWCASFCDDDAVRQALTDAVLIVNRSGAPGSVFATAAVYALGAMPNRSGLGALAVLKARVRRRNTLAQIDKAFRAAAERAGMTPEEIEEACVPTYGLTEVGRTSRSIGEFTAELTIDGLKTSLSWLSAAGKRQASVPAVVKTEHAEELKDLKADAKDIEKLLPAVRDRLDGLFRVERSWPLAVWRERYHDHPLVGAAARKLIWEFVDGPTVRSGLFHEIGWIDADGRPFEPAATATVRLWHPINCSTDEVVAWRERLPAVEIRQPFKQAHREVYRLTDAERNTATYSNRFAAHVLRQHQFAALCASRRWYYQLRVAADVDYKPPSLMLPAWNLKAEYWIEPLGEFGDGTNDAGTFVYVATDQVRFYEADAPRQSLEPTADGFRLTPPPQPLPLERIPKRIFSEVMRDVDLFVGVASVGNDPNWSDGGPEGRYRDYWQSYSFGELAASAETRREVLRGLIPKLKIADRCRFEDRFLVVRGDLRTYKIHFGSANILMEPNDEYLCIVPDQRARSLDKLFLPFDGDDRLSVILSKALLLADDKKISDPSIVRQIVRS